MIATEDLHGIMAEFDSPDALVHAVHQSTRSRISHGGRLFPISIENLSEALEVRDSRTPTNDPDWRHRRRDQRLPLQYYTMAVSYPINVAGRPFNSWQAFVPVVFELTVLTAAIFGVVSMLAFNGLPRPYHPVFNVPKFERATRDGFFLVIGASDPLFNREATSSFSGALEPREVTDVQELTPCFSNSLQMAFRR